MHPAHAAALGDGFWTADSLRTKVKYVIDSYSLSMQRVVEHPDFASAGNLEVAALTRWDGLMYIEAIQRICSSYVLRDLPQPSAQGLRQQGRSSRRLGSQPLSAIADNHLRESRTCFRSTYIYGEQLMTKKPSSPATEEALNPPVDQPPDDQPGAKLGRDYAKLWPRLNALYAELLSDHDQTFMARRDDIHLLIGVAETLDELPKELDNDTIVGLLKANILARQKMREVASAGVASTQSDVIDHSDPGLGGQSTVPNQPAETPLSTIVDIPAAAQDVAPSSSSALVVSETVQIDVDGPAASSLTPHADLRVTRSATRLIPKPEELAFITSFAPAIARSGFYPSVNTVEKATVLMLKGLSMGIQAMDALDGFDVIEDEARKRITLYPRVKLLKARVNETGQCRRFDVVSADDRCTVTIQREGRPQNVYTFTLAEAGKMGLLSHYGWKVMPKRMMMWRACGLAISMEFPEVSFGLGVADGDDEEAA